MILCSYKSLTILSGISLIMLMVAFALLYAYISKEFKKREGGAFDALRVQFVMLMFTALGFAMGMLLSSFMNSYTKMIFLTSINEIHLVV